MNVTQIVEIPVSRRLTIDVPREIPAGQVIITFTPVSVITGASERSEARDIELINRNAERLNREALGCAFVPKNCLSVVSQYTLRFEPGLLSVLPLQLNNATPR